jgi:hypothetical protein
MSPDRGADGRNLEPNCRSCTAYALRSSMLGVGMRDKRLIRWSFEMGCEKNMPAVQWMGPCPFYLREPGSDDA